MVSSAGIGLYLHALLVDGEKGGARVDPRTGVVILDAIAEQRQRDMGVAAKHTLAFSGLSITDRAAGNCIRQQQPAGIHAIQKPRDTFGSRIYFLDFEEDQLAQSTDPKILFDETIELMTVHRQMPLTLVLPHVALVYRDADQVRHQVGEAGVVVAFDPHHFHLALRIGKLADVGEELPVFAGQAAKVEVGKDVAQQNQPSIAVCLQHVERVLRPAQFGPEVDVRQNQRVVRRPNHALIMQHSQREHDEPAMNNP